MDLRPAGSRAGMRIVVTGATGNVGTALLRRLLAQEREAEIVGVARRPGGISHERVRWVAADVRDQDAMERAFRGADAVVHLAWAIQPSRDRATTRSINVDGSRAVFAAAVHADVGTLVHASSVGVYSSSPVPQRRDESYATEGLPTSFYSVDKAEVERRLDALERLADLRVVRLRPGLVFQRSAAAEIRRLFAGPLLPGRLLRPGVIPVLPRIAGVRFQAVHADDVAEAYRRAVVIAGARGAYNVAADDVLDLRSVAAVLRARTVPVPFALARAAADAAWRARLTPTPPGWLDLAARAPVLDCSRARTELEWRPTRSGRQALAELLEGLHDGAGGPTATLRADAGGPLRLGELRTGLGARQT